MRLFPDETPATVARVLRLVREGFYDGKVFQRVEPNFVIQGGGPDANEYVGDSTFMRDELTDADARARAPSASPPAVATPATASGSSTWWTIRCSITSSPSSAGSTAGRQWRSGFSRETGSPGSRR